jgi:DNA-binding NarL/FixJ family response regulator
VRLILADDASLIRSGIARLLAEQGFEITAEVSDADQLIRQVELDPPDVAIVDIKMPPSYCDEGLRAAEQIREAHPQVGVLVLSQHVELAYALRLLEHKPERVGYLLKDRVVDIDDFAATLNQIGEGGSVIDPALVAELLEKRRAADPLEPLSPREREVLTLMAEGRTDRGISEQLYLSHRTVEAHVRSIFSKLDLPTAPTDNRRVHAVLAYLGAF